MDVSVVIPTFNDAARLEQALASICRQTLLPSLVVVADDGSTDNTAAVVRSVAAQAPFRIRHEWGENTGGIEARNRGIRLTRTDWVACCDSDDLWEPRKLERQAAYVTDWAGRRDLAVLGTNGSNINDAGRVISAARMGPTTEAESDRIRELGGVYFMLHSSLLIRRESFEATGGYRPDYGAAHDADLLCRIAEFGAVVVLDEPLVRYRKRASSMQLAGFWSGPLGIDRLAENQRRKAAGRPELGVAEFEHARRQAPARERAMRRTQVLGLFLYRRGAVRVVNGQRVSGAFDLAIALLLSPGRLIAGVRGALAARFPRR